MDLHVYRSWCRHPGLLEAVAGLFVYDDGRATGYLYAAGETTWPAPLADLGPALLDELAELLDVRFTIVAFQAYLNGTGCGWHTDGPFDAQAILSLGVTRTFGTRRPDEPPIWTPVAHGDLLSMPSGFQSEWEHCIPVEDVPGERVSLVFRTVARS